MKLKLNDLKHAVNNAARNTSRTSSISVLSNILLERVEGALLVAATNLDRYYQTRIECEDGEPFAITVPGKMLSDVVNSITKLEVDLTADGTKLNIVGNGNISLSGIDAGEYPPEPKPLSWGVQIDGEDLTRAVKAVGFAASTDGARPTMTGIYWCDGYMAATDGFRIARVKAPEGVKALIPASSLVEATKHFFTSVNVESRDGSIGFDDGDTFFVAQQIEGNFPDYQQIIPKSFKNTVKINRGELLETLRRLSTIAKQSVSLVTITCEDGHIRLASQAEEIGHAEEYVQFETIEQAGKWEVSFNIGFLTQAVDAAHEENIFLHVNQANAPVQIDGGEPAGWLCIVMPMSKR